MGLYALPIRLGVATGGCLIIYFLMLSLFELHTNVLFSLFNIVLMGVGVYLAIRMFKERISNEFTSEDGFVVGMVTGVTATLLFTMFFSLYATELNPSFLESLAYIWLKPNISFKAVLFFTVPVLGFATTFVLTILISPLFEKAKDLSKKTA